MEPKPFEVIPGPESAQIEEIADLTVKLLEQRYLPQEIGEPNGDDDCESRAFTPWHSLTAHRPLGSINRLRKSVYLASANHRGTDEHQ